MPHPLGWPLELPGPSGHGGRVRSHRRGITPMGQKSPPVPAMEGQSLPRPSPRWALPGAAWGDSAGGTGGFPVPAGGCATQRGRARRRRREKSPVPRSRLQRLRSDHGEGSRGDWGTRGAPHAWGTQDGPRLAVTLVDVGTAGTRPHRPAGTRGRHRAGRGGGRLAPADVRLGAQMCALAPRPGSGGGKVPEKLFGCRK